MNVTKYIIDDIYCFPNNYKRFTNLICITSYNISQAAFLQMYIYTRKEF